MRVQAISARSWVRVQAISARSWVWFAALQCLNLVDALLTRLALERHLAVEANPVVRAIGLPGKLALMLVCGTGLLLLRPAALRIPVAVLTVVVVYTAAGIALTSA